MTDPLPPTGGPPAPETVVETIHEGQRQAIRPDRWILSQPWRTGRNRSIVCDQPPNYPLEEWGNMHVLYGGFLVLESCPLYVRAYICHLHNEGLKPKER